MSDTRGVQTVVTEYWSRSAASYDTHPTNVLYTGEAAGLWRSTWSSGLPHPPAHVLDVGTGTGHVAMELWRLGHRVTGIDLAGSMLELARAKAREVDDPPVFLVGDAVSPPFPEESFDAVTARYVLWTLREPVQALGRWRRLLRPGGHLAVVDGAWGETYADTYDEATTAALPLAGATSAEAYAAVVEAAGFRDVAVRELTDLFDLQTRHGAAAGAPTPPPVHLQHLVTARR